jgi:hypothetical protein
MLANDIRKLRKIKLNNKSLPWTDDYLKKKIVVNF